MNVDVFTMPSEEAKKRGEGSQHGRPCWTFERIVEASGDEENERGERGKGGKGGKGTRREKRRLERKPSRKIGTNNLLLKID
jgi:hypothetical protein